MNTPKHALSKYLGSILKPLQHNLNDVVQNSYEFNSKILGLFIKGNETMVSFDVASSYTNFPNDRCLGLIHALM